MGSLSKHAIAYPKTTVAICLLITVFFAVQLPGTTLDTSIKGNFPPDFPAKRDLEQLENTFGGSEIVLLGIVTDNVYSPKILKKIQRLAKEIEEMEETDIVLSLFTIKDIINTEESIEVENFIKDIPRTDEEIQTLRERLRSNPIVWNHIISEDETVTAIIATIAPQAKDDLVYKKFQAIRSREARIARLEEGGGIRMIGRIPCSSCMEFYLAGMPITRVLLALHTQQDMGTFLAGGLLLMMVLLYFSFRNVRSVLFPFIIVAMSSICTLGLMTFLGKPIRIPATLIPVILIVIVTSYTIHIIFRYNENLKLHAGQLSGQVIILNVMKDLSSPLLLVALTTAGSFGSLLIHSMPAAKELGIFAAFGIITASIFTVMFVPAWLAVLPIPEALLRKKRKKRLEPMLQRGITWFTQHPGIPKTIFAVSVVIVLLFSAGIPKISLHTNSMEYYEEQHPLVVSTHLLNEKMGGTTTIDIVFEGDISDPKVLKKIQHLQEYMQGLPAIGKTISIVDFFKHVNQAMHKGDPAYYTLPEARDLIAQYLSQYPRSEEPDELAYLVDSNYCKAHLIGRINVTGTTEIAETVRKVEKYVAETFTHGDAPRIESITGFSVLLKELMSLVVQGHIRSLLLSLALIGVISALIFRSFRMSLLCIYPIVVVIAVVFGLMGYRGIELSVTTAALSLILIGVGVNYTIQILFFYRQAVRQNNRTPHEALEAALKTSGKGILLHVLTIVVGFSIFMLSTFHPVYSFGWLLILSIVLYSITTLILLPAAILVFKPLR